MKYPKISALVPQDEHFDEAVATVNEGIYLTTAHFDNIEAALASAETLVATAEQQRTAAEQSATDAQAQLQAANDQLAAAQQTIEANAARIAELEAAAPGFSETGKEGQEKPVSEALSGKEKYLQANREKGWIK